MKTKNKTNHKEKTPKNKIKLEKSRTAKLNVEDLEITEGMNIILEKWTFKKILRNIRKGKIIIDKEFQRDEVYHTPQKSAIINSALKGISIPPLFAFEDKDKNGEYILSIIDGQQRISSVRDFLTNRYALKIPYGKYSILNGYTYKQIATVNPTLAEEIGDLTLDINIIRGISKKEAREYFGLINTTTVPLSSGEKLWSVNDPAKTILDQIINNKYFKIKSIRKTRKYEYVIATRILWNQMFNDPLKHEFVGNNIKTFVDYFNTLEDVELLEKGRDKALDLFKTFSEVSKYCSNLPRSQGDLYSTLCFLSAVKKRGNVDIPLLRKFINWVFKGINKQIYPFNLRKEFDTLSHNRVGNKVTSPKDFVIMMESLYYEEEAVWQR